jgi:hypothetical protein
MQYAPEVILALIVVPNLWATFQVSRSRLSQSRKTIFIVGTWLVPIVGAHTALREARQADLSLAPPAPIPGPRARQEHAPASVESPGLEPFEVGDHLLEGNGPPILNFDALDEWAAGAATPEAVARARADGRRVWLLHFRNWLGGPAELLDVQGSWVLSPYSRGVASAAGRYMADSRRRIVELLDGVARFPDERGVMIVFNADREYYQYIANYYPEEGEFAFSSGMFINAGCPHFVTLRGDLNDLEPVIAHEMTHFGLSHLGLPLWVDEGLAVNTEHRISSSRRHHATALELLDQHHAFWNDQTIQEFWTGKSFHRTDEGNGLSYDLARAMVELIGRDWTAFQRFAASAQREDGGAAAARAAFSLELGELAAVAVNMPRDAKAPRHWNPRPEAWDGVAVKAALRRPRPAPCAPSGR